MPTPSSPTVDPSALKLRVMEMIEGGRASAAQHVFPALERSSPGDQEVLALKGVMLSRLGKRDEALALLTTAIDGGAGGVRALLERCTIRLATRDGHGALDDAARAVELDRASPDAQAALGTVLVEIAGDADAATVCLHRAVQQRPERRDWMVMLGRALDLSGAREAAEELLTAIINGAPLDPRPRRALALVAARSRDWAAMEKVCLEARRMGLRDPNLSALLGNALANQGRRDEAVSAWEEALRMAPNEPYLRHLVAASGRAQPFERAPDAYVQAVFDGYAGRFDDHLIGLGYRVPGLVRRMIETHRPEVLAETRGTIQALDLGCGTGLIAIVTGDWPRLSWTGVDLSQKMLEVAASRGLYAKVEMGELHQWLSKDAASYDLIVAADVLCYTGDLRPFMRLVAPRMAEGGVLIVSVEEEREGGAEGHQLGNAGRYRHSRSYLEAAIREASLHQIEVTEEVLRYDGGLPVNGLIAVIGR